MASVAYTGSAYLPSVDDEVSVTALIDEEQDTVSIEFDREIGGSASWHGTSVEITGAEETAAQFWLLTQSQTAALLPSNKAVIASGTVIASRTNSGNGIAARCYDQFDNLPQLWTNGYLVAVDTMYLGGQASELWEGDVYCSLTCECTVESMSQAAAMALALSQQ